MILDCSSMPLMDRYRWLTSCISPRPVALASTLDATGRANLSPFSFFNLFSANPPIVIFAPLLRMRDGSTKHTLDNLREVPEVVIHICNEAMIQQVSLSSCEYDAATDEFVKAGFEKTRSTFVKPYTVLGAPIALECRVTEIKPLGSQGGAGQLVIAEVLGMNIADTIVNKEGTGVDPFKMPFISRMGFDDYAVVGPETIQRVPKPNQKNGIGFDNLPGHLLQSKILTGNDLALLAGLPVVPEIDMNWKDAQGDFPNGEAINPEFLHKRIKQFIADEDLHAAWQTVLRS